VSDPIARSDALDARIAEATGTADQIAHLMRASRRNRWLINVLAVSVAFDIALSAAVIYQQIRVDGITHRLDATVTTQRQKALCPLYQVFLDSRSARARSASPDPAKYDHAYEVIGDGYRVLDCAAVLEKGP